MKKEIYFHDCFPTVGVILQLLAMGVQDVLNFDFISPPSEAILQEAFKELVLLEAIETVDNQKVLIYLYVIDFINNLYKIVAFFISSCALFKRQSHKMVKHTRTIRQ